MEENRTALSPLAEAQYLALEYMRQKALTDDAPLILPGSTVPCGSSYMQP